MTSPQGVDLETTTMLVSAAQRGDRESLETLFQRYLPRARQIAALRLGQRVDTVADVEDIVQEALLRAFQKLDLFEHGTLGSFRNWVARILERALANHYRREGAAKRKAGKALRIAISDGDSLSALVIADRGRTPSEILQAREVEGRIEEAILQLPKHQRELVILCDLCEMSAAEAGAALGIANESTVRSALTRIHARLRLMLVGRITGGADEPQRS